MNGPATQGPGPAIEVGRPAPSDLPGINAVVEAAVMGWALPERVKRLALPAYRYDTADLEHLDFALARAPADGHVLGIATWEHAHPAACPEGRAGALLHGLYVVPAAQHSGIGSALVDVVLAAAAAAGRDGVLVRAQRDAEAFFQRQGFRHLPPANSERDYAGRFWKAVPT